MARMCRLKCAMCVKKIKTQEITVKHSREFPLERCLTAHVFVVFPSKMMKTTLSSVYFVMGSEILVPYSVILTLVAATGSSCGSDSSY
jgi:hypothetical protein